MASELEFDPQDTVDWCRKWLVDFDIRKTQLVSSEWFNSTGATDVKMNGSVLEEKSDWGSCIISIAKSTSKKIASLNCSMKFLSPEFTLYLYKSTMQPYMEYCCPVWAGARSCYLELLDKPHKQICRTIDPYFLPLLNLLPLLNQLKSFL